ncbi:MAG: CopD family protein [Deltaproteobacteria bacterium]|nr:CopD family protein [Deltaproteobacteria bacterium]
MLWLKAFHIIAVICWFAGIFYLPRLFVNHAMVQDAATRERLVIMSRKLFRFVTPFMVLTIGLGTWLVVEAGYWATFGFHRWLHVKLALVAVLFVYHLWMGLTVRRLIRGTDTHSHKFYRVMNELPVLILFAVVILVVVKPF